MPSFLPRCAPLLAALATLAACACSNNSATADENLEDGGVASDAGPRAGGSGAGGRGTNDGAGGAGGETGPSAGGTPSGLDADGGEAVPPAPGPDAGGCGPLDCASAPCADLAWPIGVDLVTIASRPIGNTLAVAGCGFVGVHRTTPSGLLRLITWYDAETGAMVGRGCEGRSPEAGCTLTSCLPYETGGCTRTELGLEDAAADDG